MDAWNEKALLLLTLSSFSVTVLTILFCSLFFLAFSNPLLFLPALFADAFVCYYVWTKCAKKFSFNDPWKTSVCAHGIGIVAALGFLLTFSGKGYVFFGFYMMSVAFFHLSEYCLTAIYNSKRLSIDSFLINHSMQYGIALGFSMAEYWIEVYFCSWMKDYASVGVVGLILVMGGETLRKAAMITAQSNFTHTVQYSRRSSHVLVVHGVYGYFRHPSYVGWFYWSVGTQLLLCNPISAVGFACASWMFFQDRIRDEEELLIEFFGKDYIEYTKKVGVGIPFIKGYLHQER